MVIWLNGAFGSGKSSVAEAINKRIHKSFVFDIAWSASTSVLTELECCKDTHFYVKLYSD